MLYSISSVQGRIIGIIVADTKELCQLAKEDRDILASSFRKGTKVGYILSLGKANIFFDHFIGESSGLLCILDVLGVCQEYRQQGIASLLLESLIAHLTTEAFAVVKALYLHVLTTNSKAISFYEHR